MLDGWVHGLTGISAGSINDRQDQGSNPPVLEASGVGLSFTGVYPTTLANGGDFTGRVSVGMIALAIVGLGLLYMATRNVQGGG